MKLDYIHRQSKGQKIKKDLPDLEVAKELLPVMPNLKSERDPFGNPISCTVRRGSFEELRKMLPLERSTY